MSSKHNQKWLYMSDRIKKIRNNHRLWPIFIIIWIALIVASGKDTNIKLTKEQEMRCDYQWCVIVDKPQPIPVERMTSMTGN